MVGTMMVNKKLLDRLRGAFKRYGEEVLNDPDITVAFFSTQLEEFFGVLLASPKFESMADSERQNSVWDFLRTKNSGVTHEDLSFVSQIATEIEAVEFI